MDVAIDEAAIDEAAGETVSPCGPPGVNIPAAGSRGSMIARCPSVWDGECQDGALMQATAVAVWTCGARCGDLEMEFDGGCATLVIEEEAHPPMPIRSSLHETMMMCVSDYLLGTRLDCAPSQGSLRRHVDGCTLPWPRRMGGCARDGATLSAPRSRPNRDAVLQAVTASLESVPPTGANAGWLTSRAIPDSVRT